MKNRSSGFTVVELAAIIFVIGLLATLTVVAFTNWQPSIAKNSVKSDLQTAATAIVAAKNFNNGYPAALPGTIGSAPDVVIEMTNSGPGKYCINGYHKRYPDIRISISSEDKTKLRDYLCSGASNGSVIGGSIPSAPVGINLAPPYIEWTLGGTTSVNTANELSFGSGGTTESPKVRVNGVAGVRVNAQFLTNIQSGYVPFQPDGGWLISSNYYGSDGVTPVLNSTGYSGNGCAKAVLRGAWNPSKTGDCVFNLGPNVTYMSVTFTGTSTYTSPDLKVRNVSFTLY